MNNEGPGRPGKNTDPWPGVVFLMCFMVCLTAITVVWMVVSS